MPSLAKPSKGAKGPSKPAPRHLKEEKLKLKPHTMKGKPGEHALPSAGQDPKHLIEVGARAGTDTLVAFATKIIDRVEAQPKFAGVGLGGEWCKAMRAQLAAVGAESVGIDDAKELTLPDAEALHDAIEAAKAWRTKAAAIISMTPAIAASLPSLSTGSSPAKLGASIRAMLPLAGHHQATVSGGGPALRKEGEAVLAALTVARDAHLHIVGSLSPQQRDRQLHKGIVSDELKRASRAARLLVPTEAALFSLRHLRGPQKTKKAAAPATTAPAATK